MRIPKLDIYVWMRNEGTAYGPGWGRLTGIYFNNKKKSKKILSDAKFNSLLLIWRPRAPTTSRTSE